MTGYSRIKIEVWKWKLIGSGDPCWVCLYWNSSVPVTWLIHNQLGGVQKYNLPPVSGSGTWGSERLVRGAKSWTVPSSGLCSETHLSGALRLFCCESKAGLVWQLPLSRLNQWKRGGRSTAVSIRGHCCVRRADETHRKVRGKRTKEDPHERKGKGGR